MDSNEMLKMKGRVHIELHGPDGELKEVRDIDNLVVTVGLNHLAARLCSGAAAVMAFMAVGSNNTAAANGDTALGAELGRVSLTSFTAAAAVATAVANFPAGTGTGAVTEAGCFNANPNGTMLSRTVFAVVNKGASDALAVTWTFTMQ